MSRIERLLPRRHLTSVSPNTAPAQGNSSDLSSPDEVPAIAVQDLCKQYRTHWAVDDVNFIVPKGWTVGLLGGNGAGKTTTIAMIMGLVIPSFGRAMVLGHDMRPSVTRCSAG